MREIKFRAWDNDSKSMIIASTLTTLDLQIIGNDINEQLLSVGKIGMQYTGLKDKNGVEIYEGDILGRCFDDYDENCVVKYQDGMLILETVRNRAIRPCNINSGFGWQELRYYVNYRNGFEVIGNIYENPELLGE